MKKDIYDIMIEKLTNKIEEAEKSGKPFYWVKPWNGGAILPQSYYTDKYYKGINTVLLDAGEYITYKQMQELNKKRDPDNIIKIKKGSHTQPIFFSDKYTKKDKDDNVEVDKEGKPIEFWYMKYYNVYNIEDLENIETKHKAEEIIYDESEYEELLNKYLEYYAKSDNVEIDIIKSGSRAFYSPDRHMIRVPDKKSFKSQYSYFSTLSHEMIHSTIEKLERKQAKHKGDKTYSYEELVAQIGSCLLLNIFKIKDDKDMEDNDINYIRGWLSHLKNHKKQLVMASNDAVKAVDYIIKEAEKEMDKDKILNQETKISDIIK